MREEDMVHARAASSTAVDAPSSATTNTPSKGPWKLERCGGSRHNFGIRVNGPNVHGYVAFIDTGWPHPEQVDEMVANARLIAAAPDLLSALEGMLPHTFTGPPDRKRDIEFWQSELAEGNGEAPRVLAAFAAIAKATDASSSPPQRIERPSDDQARMTANLESGDPR